MKHSTNSFIRNSHRLSLLTGLLTLTVSTVLSDGAELLKYQMGQSGPQIQDAINGAAGGNLTKASGLNGFNVNQTGISYLTEPVLNVNFNAANSPTSNSLANAVTTNSYFSFTLTAGAGTTDIDLSSLTFNIAKGGGSNPRGYGVYVTPPGGPEVQVRGQTNLPDTALRPNFETQTIDLSGLTTLQNLTASQVVTFKIYLYSPAAGSALDLDDITVNGTSGAVVVVDPAGTRTKANNTDNLDLLSSWSTGLPTATDVTQWNNVVTGPNSTVLGADLSWQGIRILNPGGLVTISGANILTLGSSGIAMGAAEQDLTISSSLTIGTGSLTWNVADLRTLTLDTGTFTRPAGTTLNLPGLGTVNAAMTNLSANTAGIVGAWATTGTGTATQYATFTGSAIGGLTGTAAADGAELVDESGTVNYDLSASGGTMPSTVSANTIRYTGFDGATAAAATSFSVNGLMNVGSGTWTLDSFPLTIGSDQELVVNTAAAGINIASVIQDNAGGASAITKVGSGVLTLSGSDNAYTGLTTINSGVLDVGSIANNSLGAGGLIFRTGTVLEGNGTFIRNFSGTASAGVGEITGFSGGFAAKGGPLTVDFGGFSAPVTLSGLTPKFGANFIFGSSTANDKVTVVNPIDLNGAKRIFTVTPGTGGDSAELSGVLSGGTTAGIDKRGTGRLLLSAANTFTGANTIAAGILEISNATALGFAAAGGTNTTSVTSGASLQVSGVSPTDPNESLTIFGTGATNVGALQAGIGGATWSGPVVLGASAARIGAVAGETLEVTGTISGAAGYGLAVSGGAGTGTIVINPTTTNTYTGTTTIVRGILRLGKENALPVASILDAKDPAASAVDDAAVFDLYGFNQTLGGILDSGANANDIITNSLADSNSTLTLNNSVAYTFDGVIEDGAGTVSLVKTGTGTQTLAGLNTYSGNTTVNVGALAISNGDALGDTAGSTTVAVTGTTLGSITPAVPAGGRLILSNSIICAENITLTGLSEQQGGFNPSIDSTAGANTLSGNITLAGTGGQRINATGDLNIDGTIARDGTNSGILVLRTGSALSTISVNNTIDLNAAGLNIQGLGTVVLNQQTSPELVSATIAFGGQALRLQLGVTNALPPTADLVIGTSNATLGADQGSFDLAGFDQTVRALSGIPSNSVAAAAEFRKITNSGGDPSVLTAGNTTTDTVFTTFNGVIEDGSGGVALTKVGEGTLTLTGANTYTGATTVSAGTLALVGASQASPITLGEGAFLGFTLGAPATSSAAVDLSAGKIRITGTPASSTSYTLLTTTATISGIPVLDGSVPGFSIIVEGGNVLKLIPNPPYSDWLLANPPATGFITDSDNDGVPNGVENVLGTNPNISTAGLTQVSATAGSATFTHTLNPTVAGDVAFSYQWSTDLVEWKASAVPNTGGTVVIITATSPVAGVVTVTGNVTGLPATAKLFLRLEANQN